MSGEATYYQRVVAAIGRVRARMVNLVNSSEVSRLEGELMAEKQDKERIVEEVETFANEVAPLPPPVAAADAPPAPAPPAPKPQDEE